MWDLYDDPALRPMSDLDILVKTQDFDRAPVMGRGGDHAGLVSPSRFELGNALGLLHTRGVERTEAGREGFEIDGTSSSVASLTLRLATAELRMMVSWLL